MPRPTIPLPSSSAPIRLDHRSTFQATLRPAEAYRLRIADRRRLALTPEVAHLVRIIQNRRRRLSVRTRLCLPCVCLPCVCLPRVCWLMLFATELYTATEVKRIPRCAP